MKEQEVIYSSSKSISCELYNRENSYQDNEYSIRELTE